MSASAAAAPNVGFTAFPFELSAQGLAAARAVVRDEGTLYAIHDDRGRVRWEEAFRGTPLPAWILGGWDDHLAAASDINAHTPGTLPPEFAGLPTGSPDALAEPNVRQAYLAFASRAVRENTPSTPAFHRDLTEFAPDRIFEPPPVHPAGCSRNGICATITSPISRSVWECYHERNACV